jgi:hypothetical protein
MPQVHQRPCQGRVPDASECISVFARSKVPDAIGCISVFAKTRYLMPQVHQRPCQGRVPDANGCCSIFAKAKYLRPLGAAASLPKQSTCCRWVNAPASLQKQSTWGQLGHGRDYYKLNGPLSRWGDRWFIAGKMKSVCAGGGTLERNKGIGA